jgi:hypothetical protein
MKLLSKDVGKGKEPSVGNATNRLAPTGKESPCRLESHTPVCTSVILISLQLCAFQFSFFFKSLAPTQEPKSKIEFRGVGAGWGRGWEKR